MRARRLCIALTLVVAALFSATSAAYAANASSTPEKSRAATGTYNLDFTLPTAGKSGCEVCHSDPNLVRIVNGQTRSMFVDVAILRESAHAKLACTQCHLDFAYNTPHNKGRPDDTWKSVAKLSCKSTGCHPTEYDQMNQGAHSATYRQGINSSSGSKSGYPAPTCGDCHGGHDIAILKNNPTAQAALHARGIKMCGTCHPQQTGDYADYYHGAAYQKGAPDAPACWDCHNAHDVYPSSDRRSPTYVDNLPQTCGRCHGSVNEQYTDYAKFIHGRQQVLNENPAWMFIGTVRQTIEGAITRVRSWFST